MIIRSDCGTENASLAACLHDHVNGPCAHTEKMHVRCIIDVLHLFKTLS